MSFWKVRFNFQKLQFLKYYPYLLSAVQIYKSFWVPLALLQVVEIASLTEHLLTDCDKKDSFEKCQRCSEALPKDELPKHIKSKTCNCE